MVNMLSMLLHLFEIIETTTSSLNTSALQAELDALTQACTLAKKTLSIYTDSWYAFWLVHTWKYNGNNKVSLPPMGIKF